LTSKFGSRWEVPKDRKLSRKAKIFKQVNKSVNRIANKIKMASSF
jgi:hypothetical protein